MVNTKGKAPKLVLMDAGFLAPWITEFACTLEALAHSDLTIRGYTDSARHFAAWAREVGLQLDGLGEGAIGGFARHHCRCAGADSGTACRRSTRDVRAGLSPFSPSVVLCRRRCRRQPRLR